MSNLAAGRSTGKIQSRVDRVDRFGSGAAAAARPHAAGALGLPAGAGAPRGDPIGPAGDGRAAALLAGVGRRARRLPRAGAGLLRPAAGRGLPDHPHRLGDPGGGRRLPAAGPAGRRRRAAAAAGGRLPARRARPGRFPRARLAVGAARGRPRGARRTARLRRPARQRGAARGARRPTCAGSAAPSPTPSGWWSAAGSPRGSNLVLRALARRRRAAGRGRGPRATATSAAVAARAGLAGRAPSASTRTAWTSARSAASGRPRGGRHAGPPVPHRRGAGRRSGGRRWSRWASDARRYDHRGRLRRRVPLRPGTGRGAAGPGPRPGGRCSARSASRWRPRCGSAGSSAPPALAEAVAAGEATSPTAAPPGSTSSRSPRLVESGRYDRHLRRMRAGYARRRGALVDALAEHAPQVELHGLAAGFHAVAHLPDSATRTGVVAAARARSVGLYGMSALPLQRRDHPATARAGVREPRRRGHRPGHHHHRRPPTRPSLSARAGLSGQANPLTHSDSG